MSEAFVRFVVGDTRKVLATMPDASIDLVLTSPPFLGLRSYLPADDPAKANEMGSEGTPGEFLDALLDVVEDCRRVLAPHGSICFELGDTYAGSGGAGGDYNAEGLRDGQQKFDGSARRRRKVAPSTAWRLNPDGSVKHATADRLEDSKNRSYDVAANGGDEWPLDKSLCLVPEMFRFALVYGFNPLTGRQTPRWRARNVVRWCRPNPPVGALADKVRPATSDMLIACVDRKRYFDLDAVRARSACAMHGPECDGHGGSTYRGITEGGARPADAPGIRPGGAPPLDHWWHDEDTFDQDAWLISTEAYPGGHYATWPQALLERPIKSMCPMRVCTSCGQPSERITVAAEGYADHLGTSWADKGEGRGKANSTDRNHHAGQPLGVPHIKSAHYETTGWTDCGHDAWRAGVVLDPFAGSGTTLAVAFGHGRSAIGIDLDARNADLARNRVGMWLQTGPWESDGDQEPGTYYNGVTERPVTVEAPL